MVSGEPPGETTAQIPSSLEMLHRVASLYTLAHINNAKNYNCKNTNNRKCYNNKNKLINEMNNINDVGMAKATDATPTTRTIPRYMGRHVRGGN